MTTKEQIVKAMVQLPDDATFEDAMDRLYVLYKIEKGIAQGDAGKKISHAEALERIASWRA